VFTHVRGHARVLVSVLGHEILERERLIAHVTLVRLQPVVLHNLVYVKALKCGKAGAAEVTELSDFEMAATTFLMLFEEERAGELSAAHPAEVSPAVVNLNSVINIGLFVKKNYVTGNAFVQNLFSMNLFGMGFNVEFGLKHFLTKVALEVALL